jgi:hypothetical protein
MPIGSYSDVQHCFPLHKEGEELNGIKGILEVLLFKLY